MRISADEVEPGGLDKDEVIAICQALKAKRAHRLRQHHLRLDAGPRRLGARRAADGDRARLRGAARPARCALPSACRCSSPDASTSRRSPRQCSPRGQADMCGMTRAMISRPRDAQQGARRAASTTSAPASPATRPASATSTWASAISCIQNPETGRERRARHASRKAAAPKRILVAGGGPAGMKAALTAAERGHDVTLCEAGRRLGGQALLAQLLPERAEFGGLVTNLRARDGARRRRGAAQHAGRSARLVEREQPDAVIVATGGLPYRPDDRGRRGGARASTPGRCSRAEANPGGRVLVADWRCDWIGMGLAEKLAREGRQVRLAVNGTHAGQNLQQYVRDHWAGQAAQARRRGDPLCAALRRRCRHRLPGAHRLGRADHRERGRHGGARARPSAEYVAGGRARRRSAFRYTSPATAWRRAPPRRRSTRA